MTTCCLPEKDYNSINVLRNLASPEPRLQNILFTSRRILKLNFIHNFMTTFSVSQKSEKDKYHAHKGKRDIFYNIYNVKLYFERL